VTVDVPEVDPVEARRLVDDGALLLDVREPEEWEVGRAPDAVHVPLASLPANRPETGRRVVAVCRTGARSAQATAALLAWGYDAVNLAGGMKAWAGAGLPVVAADGGAPGHVL
jgi:rhodanese-related sulfurtransferase